MKKIILVVPLTEILTELKKIFLIDNHYIFVSVRLACSSPPWANFINAMKT